MGLVNYSVFILLALSVEFSLAQTQCYSCDSYIDSNCATLKAELQSKICDLPSDSCVTTIVGERTIRGCQSEIEKVCSVDDSTCSICQTDNCNNEVFPANRLTCHSCTNCHVLGGNTYLSVCPYYQGGDTCYTTAERVRDGTSYTLVSYRGCYSDRSEGRTACDRQSEKCLQCEDNGCNFDRTFSTSSLSCVQCDSDNDENCVRGNIEATRCMTVTLIGEPEYCFSHKSASGKVVRGCSYDLEQADEVLNECDANDAKCKKCLIDGCNTDDERDFGTCIKCEKTDPFCQTLSTSYTPHTCSAGEEIGCFLSKINGETYRGCVSEMSTSELANCKAEESCKICTGNNCNQKVDLQRCYRCNSADNGDSCMATQVYNENRVRICEDYLDTCSSFLDRGTGTTIRGCTKELNLQSCNTDLCSECTFNLCNNVEYPLGRLKCYQCSGSECNSIDESSLSYCPKYDENDECYLAAYNNNGVDVFYRGCTSDGATTAGNLACTSINEDCIKCGANGCNVDVAKQPSFLKCNKCDSRTNPNCLSGEGLTSETCNHDIFYWEADSCYSYYHTDGHVTRGCYFEAPTEVQTGCNSNNGFCAVCQTSSCNTQNYDTGSCYTCNGNTDPNCVSMDGIQSTKCASGLEKGCFRSEYSGIVIRGCLSELTEDAVKVCKLNGECKVCEGDNCNGKVDFQKCYTCTSDDDANCVEVQTSSSSYRTCTNYLDQCITYVDGTKTYRGCAQDLNSPVPCSGLYCQQCANHYCNSIVYPTSRQICNQCNGGGDCMDDLASVTTNRKVCRNFVSGDQCYSVVSIIGTIYRGCLSDTLDATGPPMCELMGDKCLKCPVRNCNNPPAKKEAALSCVKCTSTEEDETCAWALDADEAEKCTKEVYLGNSESCYRVKGEDGVVQRGCTLDDSSRCPENAVECEKCVNDGCNLNTYNKHKCYQCTSATEASCLKDVDQLTVDECRGDDHKADDGQCYMLKQEDSGAWIRGCLRDLEPSLKTECAAGEHKCEICSGEGCNNKPGSATILSKFSLVALLIIAVSVLLK